MLKSVMAGVAAWAILLVLSVLIPSEYASVLIALIVIVFPTTVGAITGWVAGRAARWYVSGLMGCLFALPGAIPRLLISLGGSERRLLQGALSVTLVSIGFGLGSLGGFLGARLASRLHASRTRVILSFAGPVSWRALVLAGWLLAAVTLIYGIGHAMDAINIPRHLRYVVYLAYWVLAAFTSGFCWGMFVQTSRPFVPGAVLGSIVGVVLVAGVLSVAHRFAAQWPVLLLVALTGLVGVSAASAGWGCVLGSHVETPWRQKGTPRDHSCTSAER